MIRKIYASAIVLRPLPFILGGGLGIIFSYFLSNQKKEKTNDAKKNSSGKTIIYDDNLKILISEVESELVKNTALLEESLNKIKNQITLWKNFSKINEIEILCILPESNCGKEKQLEILLFGQKLAEFLDCKIDVIEKQFFYDIEPNMTQENLEKKLNKKLEAKIGCSYKVNISKFGNIRF